MADRTFRTGVFVSYSHKDREWLEKLRTALAPLMRSEKLEIWEDTQIQPGTSWESEIMNSISRARVAVLLVSLDFLASNYIASVELPAMLAQQIDGLIILWIPIRYSAYDRTALKAIQAAHDPSKPLASLPASEQDKAFVQIADRVAAAADINALANAFKIIDDFYPQLKAFNEGQPEPSEAAEYAVVAVQEGEKITFNSIFPQYSYPQQHLSAADLRNLDPDSQKLIRAYERTMKALFERWIDLKPRRVSRDREIGREATKESEDIRRDLCQELEKLLGFIALMRIFLDDHYLHIRQICMSKKAG